MLAAALVCCSGGGLVGTMSGCGVVDRLGRNSSLLGAVVYYNR